MGMCYCCDLFVKLFELHQSGKLGSENGSHFQHTLPSHLSYDTPDRCPDKIIHVFSMKIVMFSCTGGISCKDEDIFIHGECIIGGIKYSNLWDIDNRVENYPNNTVKLN